ncbi:MAG: glycosyltransferase family 4 protein [Lachnospiraceae bacterium]|nr:glycosyltransferase family 4 protein [Lachnospiraceae bacterium]
MNILVICHYGLYQNLQNSFVHHQVKALVELGHNVRVIIPIPYGKKGSDNNRISRGVMERNVDGAELVYVRYLTLSKYGEKSFNFESAMYFIEKNEMQILRNFSIDIIHAHTLGFDGNIGKRLAKKYKKPLVVTSHGSDASVPHEKGRLQYLLQCCEGIDCIVAVSSVLGKKIRSSGTKTNVVSILNGFDLKNLPDKQVKEQYSFLQVSNLLPSKRVNVTIEAFAEIKRNYEQARLYIVGSGPEKDKLERLCDNLGISDSVEFMGKIPNLDVLKKMAATQFFIMPSVREGFGIVYLEAMACGCITIGTQGEGIEDVICSGENGFLVPPDNPEAIIRIVEKCFNGLSDVQKIVEQGKMISKELSWKKNALAYTKLYKELLSENFK